MRAVVWLAPASAALAAAPVPLADVELTGEWADRQAANREVLMSLNMTQFLCHFTTAANLTSCGGKRCVAPGGAGKPACESLPGEMGPGGYYGHYQGHWLSATAFLVNNTGNATVRETSARVVAAFAGVMDAWKQAYGVDGYLFPHDPLVFDLLLSGHSLRGIYTVPFYTLHKIMAGLLDQHVQAGNAEALDLVQRMGVWVHESVEDVIRRRGVAGWQTVLLTEWGGMNDVLYNLYALTRDPRFLATARRFNAFIFTAPLADGVDDLANLPFPHANMHLPQVIGNARAYELTSNATDAAIVHTFFDALSQNHSYCTAGSNSGECWQQPRDLGAFLSSQTEESCTQYNVLKVSRHLFQWSGSSADADFYERAILNGIVGNQRITGPDQQPVPTSFIYMLPLGGVQRKHWGRSDQGFPCCWGTLSESFAKLGDSIYFTAPEAVIVNQYVSSILRLADGSVLEQVATFPESSTATTRLTVHGDSGRFALKLRIPGWLEGAARVALNGAAQAVPRTGYVAIDRVWQDGDTVEAFFPLSLWAQPINDKHAVYNATIAYMYGPLVLAALTDSDIFVPRGDAHDPAGFIRRTSATELTFEATRADGTTVPMIPLRDIVEEQYAVYLQTAGTKPVQPKVYYCPHSAKEQDVAWALVGDRWEASAHELESVVV